MPMKAVIHKNNGERPDEYAGIILPTLPGQLRAALDSLGFKPEDIDQFSIEQINPISLDERLHDYIPQKFEHMIYMDTLNHLALEAEKMSGSQAAQDKLLTALTWAKQGEEFPFPFDGTVDDVIRAC